MTVIVEGVQNSGTKAAVFSRYLGMQENFQDFLDGKAMPIKQFERALIMPQL